jgi:hypothetical protein
VLKIWRRRGSWIEMAGARRESCSWDGVREPSSKERMVFSGREELREAFERGIPLEIRRAWRARWG